MIVRISDVIFKCFSGCHVCGKKLKCIGSNAQKSEGYFILFKQRYLLLKPILHFLEGFEADFHVDLIMWRTVSLLIPDLSRKM